LRSRVGGPTRSLYKRRPDIAVRKDLDAMERERKEREQREFQAGEAQKQRDFAAQQAEEARNARSEETEREFDMKTAAEEAKAKVKAKFEASESAKERAHEASETGKKRTATTAAASEKTRLSLRKAAESREDEFNTAMSTALRLPSIRRLPNESAPGGSKRLVAARELVAGLQDQGVLKTELPVIAKGEEDAEKAAIAKREDAGEHAKRLAGWQAAGHSEVIARTMADAKKAPPTPGLKPKYTASEHAKLKAMESALEELYEYEIRSPNEEKRIKSLAKEIDALAKTARERAPAPNKAPPPGPVAAWLKALLRGD